MNFRDLLTKLDSIVEAADPQLYADAQAMMANLEKAAQYTGDDEIVRSRMGLPPKLPPIEKWDGKMPAPIGKPDWVARLTTMGKAVDDQNVAVKRNAAITTSRQFITTNMAKLKELVGKLKATMGNQGDFSVSDVQRESIARELIESFGYTIEGFNDSAEDLIRKRAASQAAAAPGNALTDFGSVGAKRAAAAAQNATKVAEPIAKVAEPIAKVAQQAGVSGAEKAAGTALAKGGSKLGGKLAGRLIPGVGSTIDAADAYSRWKEGDKTGAAISGLGALGGLIPGLGGAISWGTLAANQARDYKLGQGAFAKDSGQAGQPAAGNWPSTRDEIIAFQKSNNDKDGKPLAQDGLIGSKTYQALVKAGYKPPSNFAVTSYKQPAVAEEIINFRQRLELIEAKARITESLADEYHFDWDGNLYTIEGEEITDELTKQVIWESVRDKEVVIDEGVWSKIIGAAADGGRGVRDFFKGALAPRSPAAYKAALKTGGATKTGAKVARAAQKNPVKTALGGAALGGGLAYGLSGDKPAEPDSTTTTSTGSGSSGGNVPGGQAGQPENPAPEVKPEVKPEVPAGPTPEQNDLIKQIQDLMAQLADIEEQPVIAALQDAQATIDTASKAAVGGQAAQPQKDEFAPTATQYGAFGQPPTGK